MTRDERMGESAEALYEIVFALFNPPEGFDATATAGKAYDVIAYINGDDGPMPASRLQKLARETAKP